MSLEPAVLDGTALPSDAELRRLLATHGVVVLRLPAKLTDDDFQAMVARFGPIKDAVVTDRSGALVTYAERRQVIDAVRPGPVTWSKGPFRSLPEVPEELLSPK